MRLTSRSRSGAVGARAEVDPAELEAAVKAHDPEPREAIDAQQEQARVHDADVDRARRLRVL